MNDQEQRIRVRAAQLYDLMQDEMRVFRPSVEESKHCLAMLCGAFMSGVSNSDSEASMLIGELGDMIGFYYEKTKQINKKRQDDERNVIKLDPS